MEKVDRLSIDCVGGGGQARSRTRSRARRPSQIGVAILVVCLACLTPMIKTSAAADTAVPRVAIDVLRLPAPLRNNVVLTSVSCPDTRSCVAVGAAVAPSNTGGAPGFWPIGSPVILHFDGRTWSSFPSPAVPSSGLNGVTCVSRTNCVAVGERANSLGEESTLVEHYAGTKWTVVPSPDSSEFPRNSNFLQGVSCRSAGLCIAVGGDYNVSAGRAQQYAPLIESSVSSGWAITPISPSGSGWFTSVSCSSSRCVAVGTGTASGTTGTKTPWTALSDAGFALRGVACIGNGPCVGVGQPLQGQGISVASLAGARWSDASVPGAPSDAETNTLNSVSCPQNRSCVAVGQFIGAKPQTSESEFGPLVVAQVRGKVGGAFHPRRIVTE